MEIKLWVLRDIGDDIHSAVGFTKRDLTALGYRVMSVTTITPANSSSHHAMAIRMRTPDNGGWDCQFMRLRKSEQRWTFKAGWEAPMFRFTTDKKPNEITWRGYYCTSVNGKVLWRGNNGVYTGTLYYITYK